MTPERWQQLKELLAPALDLGVSQRSAYLEQVCLGDPSLRSDLERLLAAEDNAGTGFLSGPPSFGDPQEDSHSSSKPLIGLRVGSYKIIEEIGSGGMGEVYRAFRADDQYSKQVAIKLVRSGYDSKAVVQRFKNERQILAGLDHPNIARLLDGGETEDGLPYFVMELIEGMPIDKYCDERRLTITDRLELLRQVCSAVQYAHQHLTIHRDIKPGNILVTPDGVPKLLDFGIARMLDASANERQLQPTLTIFRALTPGYASPEQMTGAAITTASDLYSLGVVLYELLTGRSPYRLTGPNPQEIARAVCEVESEKPSTVVSRMQTEEGGNGSPVTVVEVAALRQASPDKLGKRLAGDLDNIVLMALRKQPPRRYASVEQFSQDIWRHLENLPVIARKDTVGYRTSKFLTRHKAGVAAAAAIFLTIVLGMAVTLREAQIARAEKVRAERRFNDVRALANSLLFDIHDSIRDLPGSTAARKVLVDRALQYLDSLAQEAAGDPSLERELASAYERLGDVQGKPLAASLGDAAGALQSYNKSLALREKRAQNSQAYPDDAVSLAKIHRVITNAAVESGDIVGALEHAKKAVALAASVSDSRTRNNKAAASELALDYTALGCVESGGGFNSAGLGDPFAALRDFDKALAIASQLLKNYPDDVTLAQETAVLYERIGGLQGLMMGRRPEGLQNLNVALKIFRSLAAQNNNAGFQRAVGAAASVIGGVLVMDGRFQPALASFREELAISESLSERDPQNQQARKDLTSSYYDVGGALMRLGRLGEGLAMIRSAIVLDKQLVSLDPKQAVLRSNLAQHRVAEGETLGRMGDAAGALQSYKEARSFYGGLARLDEQNLDARLNAAAADAKIAATLFWLGQFDEARETYRRALQVSEPPAGSNPPNQQAQYTLADAYSGLGDVAMYLAGRTKYPIKQLSYWREASSWYEKSLGIWHAIPNRSVVSPAWFDVGDPAQVANHLAVCKAALEKLNSSPFARIGSEVLSSPTALQ